MKTVSLIIEVLSISGKGFIILTSDHNFSFSLVYHNLMETSNLELLNEHLVENHTCCFLSDSKLIFHLRFTLLKNVYTLFCHFPFSLFNPRIFVRCHCRPVWLNSNSSLNWEGAKTLSGARHCVACWTHVATAANWLVALYLKPMKTEQR